MILAMWALFLLGTLGLTVGREVSAGAGSVQWLVQRSAARRMARAAVERARREAARDTAAVLGAGAGSVLGEARLGRGICAVVRPHAAGDEADDPRYGLVDEERCVNLNRADRPLLRALLAAAGGRVAGDADALAAAIIDWRDADDQTSPGGAEGDYYARLSPPYACHNGPFQSLHELLLVRGVTPELLNELAPHVTVHGAGGVNVNTADELVLRAVLHSLPGGEGGVGESLLRKIVAFRASARAFDRADALVLAAQLNAFSVLSPDETRLLSRAASVFTVTSTCFRGVALGRAARNVRARIEFVFDISSGAILAWHEP